MGYGLSSILPLPVRVVDNATYNIWSFPTGAPGRRFTEKVAAWGAGAKEGVAGGGAHPSVRDDEAPGPLTPASALGARPPRPMNFQRISDLGRWMDRAG